MADSDRPPGASDRYARQIQFAPIGLAGQQRIREAHVLICGCGALGSVLANTLARAGVGHLRIVDRDFLQLNNLQRQVLYDEADVASHLPKAIAAANRLKRVNSEVQVEPIVADVDYRNISSLLSDVDAIGDGTDNFETRFLLNDAAHRYRIPWVYGGCIGAEGQTMTIVPGETPCLRCLIPEVPPAAAMPSCETVGIVGSIVNVIASCQALEILKMVSGNSQAVDRTLRVFELWDNRMRAIRLDHLRDGRDCPTCGAGNYEWLEGRKGSSVAVLCGRNAVQLAFPTRQTVSLQDLERRLAGVGQVARNPFLLRLEVDRYVITVFHDGRAVIGGTADPAEARTVYARYVGL